MLTAEYQRCNRCVMDKSAEGISFDEVGNCNFCSAYFLKYSSQISLSDDERKIELDRFVSAVKKQGATKKYDCIIGVSGGIDSSWALVRAVQLGLRPLAVHMDNGWNSELAQNNISNLVEKLGVDLFTYVIEWNEYRELMLSFLEADVIDVELLYDNAMLKINYAQASRYGIKYILSGSNFSTEGIEIPKNWNWLKYDGKNIKSIAASRKIRLKSFPLMNTRGLVLYKSVKKIKWVSFLDYFDYQKDAATQELESGFSYKRYPFKHYESIFTRFYQAVILPEKFGVDKRIVHLSNLVVSGQIEREVALQILTTPTYPSDEQRLLDLNYVLKKIGWSLGDFSDYIQRPSKPHMNYGSEVALWNLAHKTKRLLDRFR